MPTGDIQAVEDRLRQMPPQEQSQLSLELASLVLPLADLSTEGQPRQGLASVAETIHAGISVTAVDEARHALLSMTEMEEDEEPGGLAWYAFGASVAWIYAADANTTAPSDGLVNTFKRVTDLLDAIDSDLGEMGLQDQLLRATSDTGRSAESWSALSEQVRLAVDQLRSR